MAEILIDGNWQLQENKYQQIKHLCWMKSHSMEFFVTYRKSFKFSIQNKPKAMP